MSIDFSLSVMPVDSDGELVLQYVSEPRFGLADSYVWELLDQKESARHFHEVVAGLDLRWYRRTTMNACLAHGGNPTTADCFSPSDIKRDVQLILARLSNFETRLPRQYRFQKSTDMGVWRTDARVFYGGKLFSVGAAWDVCRAWWWAERPFMDAVRALIVGVADIEYDLRAQKEFRCVEAVRQGGRFVPGDPLVLLVSHQSARQYFEPYLSPIVDFCIKAEAGGYLVFTSKG